MKDDIEIPVGKEIQKEVTEREVKLVMIKDGEYKYVYADTGEDVK